MAVKPRNTLKTYFETGDFPTQEQFGDALDSYIHQDDELEIENVNGLQAALDAKASAAALEAIAPKLLNAGADSWVVPAGTVIFGILVIEPTEIDFKVGTAAGLEDLLPSTRVIGGHLPLGPFMMYFAAQTTIYFSGVTINTIIKIFKA